MIQIAKDSPTVLTLIALILAAAGFSYGIWLLRKETLSKRFRASLFSLRLFSLLLLCLLLLALLVSFRYTPSTRPSVLVLLDASQSMSVGSTDGARGRFDLARDAVNGVLSSLRRRCDVELATFGGDRLRPVAALSDTLRPSADSTDLAKALGEAQRWYSGRPLDAVVLISDGRITAGGSPKVAATALGVPVFAVGFEETTARQAGKDLGIVGVDAPRASLAGNTVRIEVTLRAMGLEPAKHPVEIVEGKTVVAQSEAVFQKDQREARTDLEFIAERPGYHVYTVRAKAVPGEQLLRNNEFAFGVNVERARRRVCMIESQWRAEYRYIKRALEEDPNLKFTGFLRMKESQFKEQVEATEVAAPLPSTLQEFEFYDAVILGDVNPLTLPAKFTRLLGDYVSDFGGGLIVTGGAEVFGPAAARDSDLLALLPVTLGADTSYLEYKYPLLLTPEGARHPIFNVSGMDAKKTRALWLSMPELSSLCLFGRAKPGAEVLAVHPQLANEFGPRIVVASQQFGKGRVVVLGTDNTWNWALQEARPGFDQLHEQFWRQAVRFVARRPSGGDESNALRAANDIVYEGEPVRLKLALPPELAGKQNIKIVAEVVSPDEKKQQLIFTPADASNTVWEASFVAERTGAYRVNAAASAEGAPPMEFQTAICAQGGSPEFENTSPNNTLLKDLADSTGGKFGYVSELGRLVKTIKSTRPSEPRQVEWNSASSKLLAGLILALWAGEWMLRKLKNLA